MSEVAGAITASTLTTVAVFAPIVFVHGIAGQIFGDQAVTVVSSLLVSLLVAVLFIPMLASRSWAAGGEMASPLRAGKVEGATEPSGIFREFLGERLEWSWYEVVPNLFRLGGRVLGLGLFLLLRALLYVVGALGWVGYRATAPLRLAFDGLWRVYARPWDAFADVSAVAGDATTRRQLGDERAKAVQRADAGRLLGAVAASRGSSRRSTTRSNVASRVQPPLHDMRKLRHEDALAPQVVRHLTATAHIQ